ncbi:MAG: putative transport system permease protein [Streptosporangiaceae bacterium]|nr:putative transport system permease protein [Streptosporangiaceae bacterium]
MTWLRLELRRRWRSLTVLALLVALATATVLAAASGARRGQTAYGRLWARTLPATATVLPNQPGFDWAKIRALPEVSALTMFPVGFGFALDCCPAASTGFPPADNEMTRTIERPVVLEGRLSNPNRADEVLVTPKFVASYGKGVGDMLTLHLASPRQMDAGYDGSTGPPRGPKIRARIVGVGRTPWGLFADAAGEKGGVLVSPALFAHYRANIIGTTGQMYINALVRLKGGTAAIPAFRADLARVTGRSDIDVWNNLVNFGDPLRRVTGYEAACLLAFALAALVAAFFLVGQSVARYTSSTVVDLQVLQAVGMTRLQAVASASAAPFLAAAAGTTVGVAGAIVASRWMPIGAASIMEPHPGLDVDWPVLGAGWVIAPLLVLAGSAIAAAMALTAGRRHVAPRRSAVAAAASGAGLPIHVVVGARFALEPGRGRAAVPIRPALVGAIVGVLGVLAAFTFSAGVSDAAANPARFGQTWQLGTFLGLNGQDFGPAGRVLRAVAADRDVIGVDDARIGGAQSGQVSIESFTYHPVAGKRPAIVLTDGRMPATPGEIVLAPTTARELRAVTGSTVRLTGAGAPQAVTVTGIGFVPAGPHNGYADGAWLTPAGYDRIFGGARYSFKFHAATVALRPGANVQAVARRLNATAAAIKGGGAFTFTPPRALPAVQQIKDLEVLPLALSAFLALLAIGAVGHALSIAVNRRRHELAVMRALGMTRLQTRMVVATQASVLAVVGLVFGVPLGVALGRSLWHVVAGFTPLAYDPPLAVWALLLIGPVALLAANALAAWPEQQAARLRTGQVLRTE